MSPNTTAVASGVRATCSSMRAATVRAGSSRAVSGCSTGAPRDDRRRSGASVTWVSSARRSSSSRSTVAASKRSAANAANPSTSSSPSAKYRSRSNFTPPVSGRNGSARTPGRARRTSSSRWWTIITWNSGLRASDRSGASRSTTRSNGTPACENAARSAVRTRSSSSANVGSPDRSVRRTSGLTKTPTRPARSSSARPAMGEPSAMSSPAPDRCSSAATAACSTMNTLVPVSRARRRAPAAGSRNGTSPPRWLASAGRGRSNGRSVSSGAPERVCSQKSSCGAGSGAASRSQAA
ncbi:hypothetical protein LUX39_00640 [Actinomadura madurae]|nr:hypothetical protein [Actinomadura madurae]